MTDYYKRWSDAGIIDKFAQKQPSDFFESEKLALKPITESVESVLDIGCASGHFIKFLSTLKFNVKDYVGVDLSKKSIDRAKKTYPDQEFFCSNIFDLQFNKKFDLVNATGVIQHEPKYAELIKLMITLSSKWVVFDIKLAEINKHLVDKSVSFVDCNPPMFFNVMSLKQFIKDIETSTNISECHIYGYKTRPNQNVVILKEIPEIFSASILLKVEKTSTAKPYVMNFLQS